MSDASKKGTASSSKKTTRKVEAIAELVLEKQHGYLEARFDPLEQIGKDTEEKLSTIQADLTSLKGSIGNVKAEMGKIRSEVKGNSSMLSQHEDVLEQLQFKLADMEDRNRRCNLRTVGLAEGVEGSNAVQFLTNSLPEWFPTLGDLNGEIMRAHRIYKDDRNRTGARTMIFNVLRFTTHHRILREARKSPATVNGRRIRLSPDYSAYTLRRRQAFSQAMNTARAKGIEFSLRYPATLKIKTGGQTESFQSPKDAEDFVNSLSMAGATENPHQVPLDTEVQPANDEE